MSAYQFAEDFPGQFVFIELIQSLTESDNGQRFAGATKYSDQYLRSLSQVELLYLVKTLSAQRAPVRSNPLSERFDAYNCPFSGRHIADKSG
jgi:hypothetical protein